MTIAIPDNDLLKGLVTRPELAKMAGLVPRTIQRYETMPNGLPSVMFGGRRYYRVEAVREWILARETHPNPRRRRA